MKKYARSFSLYMIIIVLIIFAIIAQTLNSPAPGTEPYTYGKMITQLEQKEILSIDIKRDSDASNAGVATVTFHEGVDENGDPLVVTQQVELIDITGFTPILSSAEKLNPEMKINTFLPDKTGLILSFITPIIILIVTILLLYFLVQQMQGGGGGGGNKVMSFGKSRAKAVVDDKNKITFAQVAGLEEEKAELQEIVEFLKNPKKFIDIGARIPKGVLLVGPPGTGKTYLAKAVSGEAGVPFFSISGSDFVEMFVGVGASRVRDLFEQAKKNSPCIIFIDEIDAVGRRRGAGLGGGHDEREQTLNQLLVEMDGFGVNEGVIILAATNRADILDPALLRPGRFDRRVSVGVPDVKGREAVLKIHTKGKKMADDVDLKVVAQTTAGFTPADLENLLNESALLAARDDEKEISMAVVRRAFIKVGIGTEKKSHIISDKEKRMVSYHEAGHGILAELLPEIDPVHIISIIPTGWAGGYTMHLPSEDRSYMSKTRMEQEIVSLLGGRAAEQLVLGDITTGASNDIERSTSIARNMVTRYGMSNIIGPIQFGDDNSEVFIGRDLAHARNYSEEVASTIDREIKLIITDSYNTALRLLEENIDVLHKTAELLIANEKITGEEFRALFTNPLPPKERVSYSLGGSSRAEEEKKPESPIDIPLKGKSSESDITEE